MILPIGSCSRSLPQSPCVPRSLVVKRARALHISVNGSPDGSPWRTHGQGNRIEQLSSSRTPKRNGFNKSELAAGSRGNHKIPFRDAGIRVPQKFHCACDAGKWILWIEITIGSSFTLNDTTWEICRWWWSEKNEFNSYSNLVWTQNDNKPKTVYYLVLCSIYSDGE